MQVTTGLPVVACAHHVRRVGSVVRQIAEPRLIATGFDELDGRVGEQIGHVGAGLDRPSIVNDLIGIVVLVDMAMVVASTRPSPLTLARMMIPY